MHVRACVVGPCKEGKNRRRLGSVHGTHRHLVVTGLGGEGERGRRDREEKRREREGGGMGER